MQKGLTNDFPMEHNIELTTIKTFDNLELKAALTRPRFHTNKALACFVTSKLRRSRGGLEPFLPENQSRDGISERCTTCKFTILNRTMHISCQNSNRIQIDAVSLFTRQMKPYRVENVPFLAAFSNRPGFGNSFDRCRVNRRRNRIENDAGTNETAFV